MESYKKHRPNALGKIVGNATTVKSIKEYLASDSLPHFILLSGPSGCGKTTIARIIKEKLGCSKHDFYEINCANRNGVELARDIEQKFNFLSVNGSPRVWLIDECHRMTAACANSLLKPLEDTPDHVYFIFATTEPNSVPRALRTRATEYTLKSLTPSQIAGLIEKVSKKDKVTLDVEVLEEISKLCEGSARLALVLYDKAKSQKDIDSQLEIVKQSTVSEKKVYDLLKVLMGWGERSWPAACAILKVLDEDPESVRRYILGSCANQLIGSKQKNRDIARDVIDCFEKDFYTTGKAGLYAACYDAILG